MVICTALSSYFKYPPILFVRHAWWIFPSTKNHAQRIPAVLSFHLPNQGNAQTTQTVVRNKSASPWPARQVRLLRGAVGDLAWVAVCKQVVTTNLVFFPEGHPALPWPVERVKKKKQQESIFTLFIFLFFFVTHEGPAFFSSVRSCPVRCPLIVTSLVCSSRRRRCGGFVCKAVICVVCQFDSLFSSLEGLCETRVTASMSFLFFRESCGFFTSHYKEQGSKQRVTRKVNCWMTLTFSKVFSKDRKEALLKPDFGAQF